MENKEITKEEALKAMQNKLEVNRKISNEVNRQILVEVKEEIKKKEEKANEQQ